MGWERVNFQPLLRIDEIRTLMGLSGLIDGRSDDNRAGAFISGLMLHTQAEDQLHNGNDTVRWNAISLVSINTAIRRERTK